MAFLDFLNMADDEAEVHVARYWDARDERLAWFERQSGLHAHGDRESLIAAWQWMIAWWDAGGASATGTEGPLWYPEPEPDSEGVGNGPALLMADALGYLWADYVQSELPVLRRTRCREKSISHNEPVLEATEDRYSCPFSLAYTCFLGLKDDDPARGVKPAGRDPQAPAIWADVFLGRAREALQGTVGPFTAAPGAAAAPAGQMSSGDPAIDEALTELGLSWPLHIIAVDDERNGEAEDDEPQELSVVFDDVSGHEFEAEIDALAERLRDLSVVEHAEREDREFILVELRPGTTAQDAHDAVNSASIDFMRAALSRRYG